MTTGAVVGWVDTGPAFAWAVAFVGMLCVDTAAVIAVAGGRLTVTDGLGAACVTSEDETGTLTVGAATEYPLALATVAAESVDCVAAVATMG